MDLGPELKTTHETTLAACGYPIWVLEGGLTNASRDANGSSLCRSPPTPDLLAWVGHTGCFVLTVHFLPWVPMPLMLET